MTVIIRLASSDDATAISRIACSLAERHIAHEFTDAGRSNLLACCTPDAIANYLQSGYRFHVAEDRGRIVGTIAIRDDRHLFHLFVVEDHQRRGIARRLWDVARSAAAPGNADAGFTVNSSRYAVPVYQAFGFVETGPAEDRNGVVSFPMRLDIVRR